MSKQLFRGVTHGKLYPLAQGLCVCVCARLHVCASEPSTELSCVLSVAAGWWWSHLTDRLRTGARFLPQRYSIEEGKERETAFGHHYFSVWLCPCECDSVKNSVYLLTVCVYACSCVCLSAPSECVFIFVVQYAEANITDWVKLWLLGQMKWLQGPSPPLQPGLNHTFFGGGEVGGWGQLLCIFIIIKKVDLLHLL